MLKLYQDNFDSNIFGGRVYKMFFDKKVVSDKTISDVLKNHKISYLYCFTNVFDSNIFILEKLGFRLISIRNTYKRTSGKAVKTLAIPKGFRVLTGFKGKNKLKNRDIENIAKIIGRTSRYFKDKKLPQRKCLKLYMDWIKNSLYHGYADESYLVFKKKILAGIITLKIKPEGGYVDLIGIFPRFQNRGLGKLLLQLGDNYLIDKKIKNMYAVTEGENVPANRFYQKNNFILDDVKLVYHKSFKSR